MNRSEPRISLQACQTMLLHLFREPFNQHAPPDRHSRSRSRAGGLVAAISSPGCSLTSIPSAPVFSN
jgi:hypothetical protein